MDIPAHNIFAHLSSIINGPDKSCSLPTIADKAEPSLTCRDFGKTLCKELEDCQPAELGDPSYALKLRNPLCPTERPVAAYLDGLVKITRELQRLMLPLYQKLTEIDAAQLEPNQSTIINSIIATFKPLVDSCPPIIKALALAR